MKEEGNAMRKSILRKLSFVMVAPMFAACFVAPAHAQFQNPIQAAKDAYKKAKQQQTGSTTASQPASAPAAAPANTASQPASTPPANAPAPSAAPADAQGAGTVWTPPSDTATTGKVAAPVGPLDPSKLPDVGGIHIGATSAEVTPVLQKLHPGAPLQTIANGQGKPPSGVRLNVSTGIPTSWDTILVDYSYEPNKPQTVYFVSRSVRYVQPIARQNVLDALRQKYGKETEDVTTGGVGITAVVWLFDEQGHVVYTTPSTASTNGTPFGCQGDYAEGDGLNLYLGAQRDDFNNHLAPATYCDSLIELHVALGGVSQIDTTQSVLIDKGLLRRSGVAIGEGQKADAAKQHQIDLQKANQAKPSL
jgi:hypothetical protein